jgi:hypothetical protein
MPSKASSPKFVPTCKIYFNKRRLELFTIRMAFVGGGAIMLLGTVLFLPLASGFDTLKKVP